MNQIINKVSIKFLPFFLPLGLIGMENISHALPVLNENSMGSEYVTVFPDQKGSSRFYLAPNYVGLATDSDGSPLFSYTEHRGLLGTFATIQAVFQPYYDQKELSAVKERIKAFDSMAQFVAMAFTSSNLRLAELNPFVSNSDCEHAAGLVESQQMCVIRIRPKGREVIRNWLKDGKLAISLHFDYQVDGVSLNADGSYANATRNVGVAGRLGPDFLKDNPELFRDRKGRIIP